MMSQQISIGRINADVLKQILNRPKVEYIFQFQEKICPKNDQF